MCKKFIVFGLSLLLISSAGARTVTWDFENGRGHGFTLWSLYEAWPTADDPNTAGDEALTGLGGAHSLPEYGVAWTIGPPTQFDGLKPPVDVENARVDSDGLLDYSLGTERIATESGTLNTYNLNQHGDFIHTQENDQIATSPAIQLDEGAVLRVWSWGGGDNTHAPEYDADPAQIYTDGSSGIAVVSAEEDDMYALLASVHTQGHGTLTEDTLDLSEFAGKKVFIDVVDAFEGGWGWLAIEAIEISNRQQDPNIPQMVAHWPLDYGVGGLVQDIVGGNDGTVVGLDSSTWINGRIQGAMQFDNIDGHHVEVPHSDALDFGDEDFSISMLVRYTSPPTDEDRWIVKGTTGAGNGSRYEIFHTSGDTVRFTIDNGPSDIKSRVEVSEATFITGEWVHVVAVRDAANDQMSLYADGVLLSTATDNSGNISNSGPLWIGELTDGSGTAMSGDIDDVRIFDKALTEAEIASLYKLYEGSIIEVADELLVDISAADPSAGTEIWVNNGVLGDFQFVTLLPESSLGGMAPGTPGTDLILTEFEGVPVVDVNSSTSHLAAYVGPEAPSGIIGNGDRSVEAWVADDEVPKEQNIICWGHRGGNPDGSNNSFSYGWDSQYGAMGQWGDSYDVPWTNDVGGQEPPEELPELGKLHHLVYTYDGQYTVKLYVDGEHMATRTIGTYPDEDDTPDTLHTHEGTINLFVQADNAQRILSSRGLPVNLLVNSIRVHDGVLTDAQVLHNYNIGPAE
jgi:hypothetical protein